MNDFLAMSLVSLYICVPLLALLQSLPSVVERFLIYYDPAEYNFPKYVNHTLTLLKCKICLFQ